MQLIDQSSVFHTIIGILSKHQIPISFAIIMSALMYGYNRFIKPTITNKDFVENPFEMSILTLTICLLDNEDGDKEIKLGFIKRYFIEKFGEKDGERMFRTLKSMLKEKLNIHNVCAEVKCSLDYSVRLQLLQYLFGIVKAGEKATSYEPQILEFISTNIGIHTVDYESIKAMFGFKSQKKVYRKISSQNNSAYTILGVTSSSTNEEVKKAYRQMVTKYHPDKVSHLGEKVKADAEEKLRRLNAAYEQIKNLKGIK